MSRPVIDEDRAVEYLMRILSVEGPTGSERAVGEEVVRALREVGVPASAIRYDDANERIPLPTETGNLIVDLPGDPTLPRRMFMAHLDTVSLAKGARPERQGERIVSSTPTALGGDDRAGVASLVHMAAVLTEQELRHPPLSLLFTVREESGLWGARHVDRELLQEPGLAFNLDGPVPNHLYIGALGGATWSVEITGQAAHAGLQPDQGISAPMVAARALSSVERDGWFGRVEREDGRGTSNVGQLAGRGGSAVGDATNVVTDFVRVEGEARSHEADFILEIVDAYRRAFEAAATGLPNREGAVARVEFTSHADYDPFRLQEDSDLVRFARERVESIGLAPELHIGDGGLDANWTTRLGIPTVTYGTGQRDVHTVDEWIDLPDYLHCCRLSLALAMA